MLTFGELAWAAYIYAIVTQGDKAYWKVDQSRNLIDGFVRAPRGSDLEKIEEVVVRWFLNGWGLCRIPGHKVRGIASGIADELGKLDAAEREVLSALSIGDVGAGRLSDKYATRVKNLYNALSFIDGCGATVVSKILFVLFPKLFLMWDWPIRDYLRGSEPPIPTDNGQGYVTFLRCGGEMAKSVSDDFRDTLGQRDTPEDYLSGQLYARGKTKTLAKYLDEYLWIKITNIGAIAEQDMPSDLFPPPEWLTALVHS